MLKSRDSTVQDGFRFWGFTQNKVQVRLWNLMFIGHGTNVELLKGFSDALEGFDLSKMIQVSMNVPSVNLKFLGVLENPG